MYNLIISNVLDEGSHAKKHIGSKEKLAFVEFRVLYFRRVTQNRSQAKLENRLHPFCHNTLFHTLLLLFTCKFFSAEKARVQKITCIYICGVSWVYYAIKITNSFLWKVI